MEFVVNRSVKDFFRRNKMRVGILVYETLDLEVERLLQKAIERAKDNGRTTVLEQDL